MSGFAALMALSASQTREVQSAVQTALEQRQRNEELKRKKREEEERKIREEEAKLRQKRFEDEKKQRELEAKRVAELARREEEQIRREEDARNALLYGPKKAKQQHGVPKWPTSTSGIKDEVRRRRMAEEDEGGSRSGSPAMALTREEKRQRRVDLEMRRTYQLKRASSGYAKAGRRLPGGAIDTMSAPTSDSGASAQSVKARLSALPNTLTKLNVNKRDTRTIDEILQDRAKAKHATLDGDDAREFNDWFGRAKKKEPASLNGTQSSASLGSGPESSGGDSPSQGSTFVSGKTMSSASSTKSSLTIPKLSSAGIATKHSQSRSPVPKSHATKWGPGSAPGGAARSGKAPTKKRPRTPSLSPSPPPPKRRASEPDNSFRSEIWRMFGKDRNSYVGRDVLSDDEDMEADAGAVMKEEMRSARLARREDEIALEEEKRHEEEKRRRKRDRQGL